MNSRLISSRLRLFPNLRRAYVSRLPQVEHIRLGSAPIPLEWLTYWTPRRKRMLRAVENQFDTIRRARVKGYENLLRRLGSGDRLNTFGVLAEIFVAAWYVRSKRTVAAVGQQVTIDGANVADADITLADKGGPIYVEVFETAGIESLYAWEESWAELNDQLSRLRLDRTVTVNGGTFLKMQEVAAGVWLPGEGVNAPLQLDEIGVICKRVAERAIDAPIALGASAFGSAGRRYPQLAVEITLDGSEVYVWRSANGFRANPQRLADKVLKKPRRLGSVGRTVLCVEVTRLQEETMRHDLERAIVQKAVARAKPRWDAILAYERDWTASTPRRVQVLRAPADRGLLPHLRTNRSMAREALFMRELLARVKDSLETRGS